MDFLASRTVIFHHESVQRQDDVNFISTGSHGHFAFAHLDFQETLGRRETTGDRRHMDIGAAAVLFHDGSEIGIDAD